MKVVVILSLTKAMENEPMTTLSLMTGEEVQDPTLMITSKCSKRSSRKKIKDEIRNNTKEVQEFSCAFKDTFLIDSTKKTIQVCWDPKVRLPVVHFVSPEGCLRYEYQDWMELWKQVILITKSIQDRFHYHPA